MDGDQLVSRKRDNHSGPDFLSDLPLDIIHCILELVPITQAIRTCILSRRWRYIWATLPRLVFEACYNPETKTFPFEWKDLKTFITNVLFLHKGPIHKFRLSYSLALANFPEVDHWLLCLSRNDIKELFLEFRYYEYGQFRVHSSLFSCQRLVHLELHNCILPPTPPSFKGFSCLKSLVLFNVKGPPDLVESLVANSPLLENFTAHFSTGSELRIKAPNLKTSDLSGDFKEIDLYAPLMAELSVSFYERVFIAEQPLQKKSVCNFTKSLGCFTNLKMFTGCRFLTKYLSIGIESYDHSLVFHHLKIIKLYGVNSYCPKEMLVVVRLIMSAPNLKNLNLLTGPLFGEYALEAPHISFSDFGCTFNTLRDVNFRLFSGLPYEMKLIKFLLRSSTVLKMMTLECSIFVRPEEKSNLMAKLLRYSRASPNAEILVLSRRENP